MKGDISKEYIKRLVSQSSFETRKEFSRNPINNQSKPEEIKQWAKRLEKEVLGRVL